MNSNNFNNWNFEIIHVMFIAIISVDSITPSRCLLEWNFDTFSHNFQFKELLEYILLCIIYFLIECCGKSLNIDIGRDLVVGMIFNSAEHFVAWKCFYRSKTFRQLGYSILKTPNRIWYTYSVRCLSLAYTRTLAALRLIR